MKLILSLFIVAFIIFSFFNITFNLIKIPFEIRDWAFIDESQKRFKSFGEYYYFVEDLDSLISESSKTLFTYDDGRDFFLARYFLYPKKIDMLWIHSNTTVSELNKFDYLVSNNRDILINGFIRVKCIDLADEASVRCIFKKQK